MFPLSQSLTAAPRLSLPRTYPHTLFSSSFLTSLSLAPSPSAFFAPDPFVRCPFPVATVSPVEPWPMPDDYTNPVIHLILCLQHGCQITLTHSFSRHPLIPSLTPQLSLLSSSLHSPSPPSSSSIIVDPRPALSPPCVLCHPSSRPSTPCVITPDGPPVEPHSTAA